MSFFAYLLTKPHTEDSSGIFYVGKGTLRRARVTAHRNVYCQRIIAKYGVNNIQVAKIECSSEEIAFDLERGLIKCLRRSGVKLANLTDGGEGCSNPSPETRKKMSAVHRGKTISDEQRALISDITAKRMSNPEERAKCAGSLGKKRVNKDGSEKLVSVEELQRYLLDGWSLGRKPFSRMAPSEETIQKIRSSNTGKTPWNKGLHTPGIPRSEETKSRISESRTGGRWITDGTKEKFIKDLDLPEGWVYGRITRN